ncbi:uncharacterized protein JN550_010031 [Neoarthrinium moseri]|uniref:uncharacterized protein n=1 Tax=Neoarthrinium moseri TaxID=1658444 RepID=UPI001FDBD157|nr:uncharacterized protein JN550_010031 [Neoarthrinium moseri]KAI1862694.1 hypothetical protein JN550_010031 [Neoarthrinium moseri]
MAEDAAALCVRCKTEPAAHDLRTENVCSKCFTPFISAKTIKRIEQLQRSTRALGRPAADAQRYLVALRPGGVSSTALLSVLWDNVRQQRARGQRVKFDVVVAVVDTDLSVEADDVERDDAGSGIVEEGREDGQATRRRSETEVLLDAYRARFPDVEFTRIPLADALTLDTVSWAALPRDSSESSPVASAPARRLAGLLARLPSTTSRADVVRLLTRHLLVRAAGRARCDVLLLGYNTTSLAALTLAETAKGRGFGVPWAVQDGEISLPSWTVDGDDTRNEADNDDTKENGETHSSSSSSIPVYHPLRELFRKELVTYTGLTDPPLTPLLPSLAGSSSSSARAVVSHKDLSIDDVMTRYFGEVEASYPSVVANVDHDDNACDGEAEAA